MKYEILGKTGLEVSRFCLGMMSYGNSQDWFLELDEAKPLIKKAIDLSKNYENPVVLVLGKGDEETQIIYDKKFELNDRQIVTDLFS